MRAPPGTPSTTRAVQPPESSTDPASSSGGRGTPARRHTRLNARSRAGTAEPLMASIVSRHGNRSEEHTSELQSRLHLVCRLLLEKKKNNKTRKSLANTSH